MIPNCSKALFSFTVIFSICSYCKSYDDDDDDDGDCECLHFRISLIPVVKDDYEGRELFAIPENNGKIITTKEICYSLIIEEPLEYNLFTTEFGKIKKEMLFDMGAEDEYYRDIDSEIINLLKNVNQEPYVKLNHNIKLANIYYLEFMNKINSIIKNNTTKEEKKENVHVAKRK